MSIFMAFVLGLLIGWVIEWIIDWVYWRRRSTAALKEMNLLQQRSSEAEARNIDLEHQLAIQKVNLASLQEKLTYAEAELKSARAGLENPVRAQPLPPGSEEPLVGAAAPVRAEPIARDDLEIINGIGPVIAGKLNQAGIYCFADLATLTPARLRELVGDVISRLANEESIIEQARLLAEKSQGG